MVEYKQWEALEAGKERMIREAQNFKLIEQCGLNGIKVTEQLINAQNSRQQVLEKVMYDKGYEDRLTERKKENEVVHQNTLEYKI